MTNPPKKKGTAAEVDVVGFLRANGYPHAERRALAGIQDRGDVAGIPGVVIEVKNHATMALSAWVDEVTVESEWHTCGAGQLRHRPGPGCSDFATIEPADAGVVWHKRARKASPGDWYVTMDGWTFTDHFLKEYTR